MIKRAAIQRDDTKEYFYLPPFSFQANPAASSTIEITKNPITGKIKQVTNTQNGWDISISGLYKCASDTDGLLFQQAFRDFLRDANGAAGTFHFVDWVGEDVKRFWHNCYLAKDVEFGRGKGARVQTYSLALTSSVYALATTSTDGSTPGAGPYEVYYPTGGGSGGSGSTGGTVVIVEKATDTINFILPARIDTPTNANNAPSRQIKWVPDTQRAVTVKSVQIAGGGALAGTSGQTTIQLSDTDYQTAGNSLNVSVPYNSNYSDVVTGSLTIAAGQPLYLYVTSAARHSDLEVMVGISK